MAACCWRSATAPWSVWDGEQGDLVIAAAAPDTYVELVRVCLFPPERCTVPPTLANGRFYCRTGTGRFTCLDVGP